MIENFDDDTQLEVLEFAFRQGVKPASEDHEKMMYATHSSSPIFKPSDVILMSVGGRSDAHDFRSCVSDAVTLGTTDVCGNWFVLKS